MQSDRSDMLFLSEPSKFKGRFDSYTSSEFDNVIRIQKPKKPQSPPVEVFRWADDQQANWGNIWESLNSSRVYPKEISSQLERLESKVDSELSQIRNVVSEISGTISNAILFKYSSDQSLTDDHYLSDTENEKPACPPPEFFDLAFINFDPDNITDNQMHCLQMALELSADFPIFAESATKMLTSSKGKNRAMAARVLAAVNPEKALVLLPNMIAKESNGTARNVAITALRSIST